jgi:hypothetical protein
VNKPIVDIPVLQEIRDKVMKELLPEFQESLGKKYKVKYRDGCYIISSSKIGETSRRTSFRNSRRNP